MMVPTDKQKAKVRQASLLEQSEDKADSTDRLVAQAFDSNPQVRLKVAQELGKIDDPRAIFALIELSSDKEEVVKEAARRSLGQFKEETETIVSLEKLLAERKVAPKEAGREAISQPAVSQRMMPTIERLFSHYEPKKRESVKRKLFPSLQKLFGFREQELADPLKEVEHIEHAQEKPAVVIEEEREKEEMPRENASNFPFGQKREAPKPEYAVHAEEDDLVDAGSPSTRIDMEPEGEEEGEEQGGSNERHGKYFDYAYKIATTPGMGKGELRRECGRIITTFKREVELAFKMAEEKAKEDGFQTVSSVKPGMRNLSFSEMQVTSVSGTPLGTRKKPIMRMSISDGKKEMTVLIPTERAAGIRVGDFVALKSVSSDFLVESNEVVLVVKQKSKVLLSK